MHDWPEKPFPLFVKPWHLEKFYLQNKVNYRDEGQMNGWRNRCMHAQRNREMKMVERDRKKTPEVNYLVPVLEILDPML